MNNLDKIYRDLIDEAYENYRDKCKHERGNEPDWMQPEIDFQYLTQEEFINKIKTDDKFAKRWGVTIETKELTEDERINLLHIKHGNKGHHIEAGFNMLDEFDIPKKLIRATYKNKTIENYE